MSEENSEGKCTIGRRRFILGAASLAAAGAAGSLFSGLAMAREGDADADGQEGNQQEQIFAGVCRGNCAGGCFLNVHVRDGQVVRTTARDMPDARYNRICSKGVTQVGRLYSSRRLQYPMRRIGERGSGQFERISWDEAMQEIADRWSGYTKEFGPAAMAVQYGSGNYAVCSGVGLGGAIMRFMNATGCSYIPNNVDAAHGYLATKICTFGLYGSQNEPADLLNSDAIVCWGSNPSVSQPQIMHFILDAKERGATYVVIDTMFNANAAKADVFIPVNPSTDGALALGIVNLLFERGLIDQEFVRAHTNAACLVRADTGKLVRMSDFGVEPSMRSDPATGVQAPYDPYAVVESDTGAVVSIDEAVRPLLTGVEDARGVKVVTVYDNLASVACEYTAQRVQDITGISPQDLETLVRLYTQTEHVNTLAMFGDNHYVNGHYNYWPIYAVSWLTGHVGGAGNACGFGEAIPVTSNLAGALGSDTKGNPFQGQGPQYVDNKINALLDTGTYGGWGISADYDDTVAASGNVDVTSGGAPATPLKGVYVMCSNPAANHADHEYTLEWLRKLDFVVVADMNMTETARYADILLPVAHWFEQEDLFSSYGTHLYMLVQEKAVEPIAQARPDYDIICDLARRLGYPDAFGDMGPRDYMRLLVESDANAQMGISFDDLMRDKAVKYMPMESFVSYEGGVFNTGDGRGRLYTDDPAPAYDIGQRIDYSKELAPYWEPALEADPGSVARQTYPFYLLSEHMRTRTHSQWWDVDYLKEYEPEPCVKMSPQDAAQKGVSEGDVVRMFNARGSVTLKAHLNAGLPRGMVACPRSWQAEEYMDGHLASLPANEFNQVVANMAFNDVAVDIERV